MASQLRQLARSLTGSGVLSHAQRSSGMFAGDALRFISNTAGANHAEPQMAEADPPRGSTEAPSLPRWERELGVIRTDWT
jgi:hypothetical protein